MSFGNSIKQKREAMALSRYQLAKSIHTTVTQVAIWESGRKYPNIKQLIMISDELGLTLDELIKGDPSFQKKIMIDKNNHDADIIVRFSIILEVILFVVGLLLIFHFA
ncbi:helix-turn-helix transcriptional regulator [Lacticaseibacillus zeae]|uniref:Helix-turn-helix transcriptional regulator n=1 Tax=Lacticaseibacillus zeae TaxID=57037 RepID=A0A5R8LR66_LACZE|nr:MULTISPECIES: helix-turn-helix transcriptional regulator [Lacticaseibacillus]KLI75548.1 hypothetical protein AAW28_08590 [Lacticaseibacillus casei]TLF39610.1 helix-turn-helix transcriptional regulator [Lacticaseibacillus zeae]